MGGYTAGFIFWALIILGTFAAIAVLADIITPPQPAPLPTPEDDWTETGREDMP